MARLIGRGARGEGLEPLQSPAASYFRAPLPARPPGGQHSTRDVGRSGRFLGEPETEGPLDFVSDRYQLVDV